MVAPNDPSNEAGAAPRPISREKLRANRRNARLSTGPRTPDGKARAAHNAVSHGIFCRDLLLPGEDGEALRAFRRSVIARIRPQDALELLLVERIVQAQWRLNRCQAAEREEHAEIAARFRRQAQSEVDSMRWKESIETRRKRLARKPNAGDAAVLAQFDRLEQRAKIEIYSPGVTLRAGLLDSKGNNFDRLQGYEQKLERTITRALLELRRLRDDDAQAWADLPESPYAADGDDEAVDNATPSPRVIVRGEGPGGCHDDAGSTADELSASEPDSTPHVARPSPHASALSTGEREQMRKNEPTAENSPATPGPAESSGDASRQDSPPPPECA